MSTFFVHNFGCRATQADGAALERDLIGRGLIHAISARDAEVVVLNTCTVTAEADRDVRAAIRRTHRENPGCRILVTGCYAQRAPHELEGLPGVSWVVGNSHKHQIGEIINITCHPERSASEQTGVPGKPGFGLLGWGSERARVEGPVFPVEALVSTYVGDIFAHTELLAAPVFDGLGYDKTRPNLKVQDGCDNRCSFCIIPFVRGQSRSLRRDDVLREMDALLAAGFREVVISGINLGRWGRDLDPAGRFEELVRAILDHTGVERLRLSSIEPMDWTDELIELVAGSPRVARHAHVPLQTGSDRVLRRMHRKYRPWHYEDRIRKIRLAMPMAAIGADVMVGFPGETDAEFEENRRFIASLPFTYLHVFTYSPRPGTPAAEMAQQVAPQIKRERNRVLRELAAGKKTAFMQSLVGQTVSTITLSVGENGRTESLTDNYQKLWLEGRHAANQIVSAQVREVADHSLMGLSLGAATTGLPDAPDRPMS
ncbi:MAG TPA: tRNA (N(6)-L-threonylcarbamoyladenosine(37)-C(2))-methylthiotransferase MtaB [Terriglobales bacterium]|nr:tRNA (N(6)-L-threonylcarbamoyladenosine(37)-C(2))-methylthiotransferase MtaB [Terriglobales bacterium]